MAKRKVKSQSVIWLLTIKSQESTLFICMKVMCHILLERFQQGLQLYFRPHLNRKFAQEVINFQSRKNHNFKTPNLGVSRQNDIWVLALWPSIENTIRGKVVASPKFRPWWILWVHVNLWLICAPKMIQLCTNQLDVWLCKFVWIIDSFITCLNPCLGTPACPLSSKCYKLRSVVYPNFLSFRCFHLGLTIEFIKELGDASTIVNVKSCGEAHQHL
jgi:hypothetical protein